MKKIIISALLYLLINSQLIGQAVNLPLEHWAYSFLERCEAKGLITSFDLRVKPVSRVVLAELIIQMEQRLQTQPGLFSTADWQLFEQLKGDLVDELAAMNISIKGPREKHALTYSEQNSNFYVDIQGRETIISNRGDQYDPAQRMSETTLGGIIRGNLGGVIGFYADARNSLLRGSDVEGESFDVSQGSPVVTSGSNVYRDRATGYFTWEKPWLRLEVGRDEFAWGPGSHGALSISANNPPADMLRLGVRMKRFQFTSVHQFLSSSIGSKYLAAHRLDFLIKPGLTLGATETVVYGGCDVEPAYINPLIPYHVAEHHLGDQDNNTMSFDFSLNLIPNTRIYGEYFIDDMTSTESLTGYFGNKFAFLTGITWADALFVPKLDVQLEYARIEPFVYAHQDSINIYVNYDKSIGHWLGPNADSFYLLAGYQFDRDIRLELSAEHIRKGQGDLDTTDRPDSGVKKTFLGGNVESRSLFGIKLTDQVRRDAFIALSYTFSKTGNLQRQNNNDSNDHLARFEFYFNY
ncbi:MAG TPA: capsule assembly Wzi family protein [bacterium]|nr:capsule assembly Wzi family protein [bacterium]HPN45097.1 capsule assembly Wzi family protein [bacterium]